MDNSELRKLAVAAANKAYSPYSNALVGCALETSEGSIYTGCNIENASFGGTVCAERVAILKAISEKKVALKKIYVYTKEGWPPCGLCRQVMSEFADKDLEVIIGSENGNDKSVLFSELMPYTFTPDHLNLYITKTE